MLAAALLVGKQESHGDFSPEDAALMRVHVAGGFPAVNPNAIGVQVHFRDVAVLEELIRKQVAVGGDIGGEALLVHYQRWRRFDNVSMLAVTDGLNQLFCSSLLPVKAARGLGMWAVNRMPPLKRFFMKHAMGLVGDVPEAMRKAV